MLHFIRATMQEVTANVRVMLYMNDQTAYAPFVDSVIMRQRRDDASCCSSTVILASVAGAVLNDS